MPQYLKERTEGICEREGRIHATFYQNLLGSPAVFTVDPKNIQTILATQFKDFGLGAARNNNFYPLLGWGIVSPTNSNSSRKMKVEQELMTSFM